MNPDIIFEGRFKLSNLSMADYLTLQVFHDAQQARMDAPHPRDYDLDLLSTFGYLLFEPKDGNELEKTQAYQLVHHFLNAFRISKFLNMPIQPSPKLVLGALIFCSENDTVYLRQAESTPGSKVLYTIPSTSSQGYNPPAAIGNRMHTNIKEILECLAESVFLERCASCDKRDEACNTCKNKKPKLEKPGVIYLTGDDHVRRVARVASSGEVPESSSSSESLANQPPDPGFSFNGAADRLLAFAEERQPSPHTVREAEQALRILEAMNDTTQEASETDTDTTRSDTDTQSNHDASTPLSIFDMTALRRVIDALPTTANAVASTTKDFTVDWRAIRKVMYSTTPTPRPIVDPVVHHRTAHIVGLWTHPQAQSFAARNPGPKGVKEGWYSIPQVTQMEFESVSMKRAILHAMMARLFATTDPRGEEIARGTVPIRWLDEDVVCGELN